MTRLAAAAAASIAGGAGLEAARTPPDAHLPKTCTQTSQAIRPYPRVTSIRAPPPGRLVRFGERLGA